MVDVRRKPPQFTPGDVVRHKRYGYRGIVAASDPECQADESWYRRNQTQPNRNQPWHHVLVDDGTHITYVAESNLDLDITGEAIQHPLVAVFFHQSADGQYQRNDTPWPGR